jgi:RND family efflux transporter MFP subunit
MKNYVPLLLACALAACAGHEETATRHSAPAVTTVPVQIGTFEETVSAVGRLGGVNGDRTNLSFLVPGVIERVYVHIGDRVAAGDPLAALDPSGYGLTAAQARSDVAVAAASARAAAVDRYGMRLTVDAAAVRRAKTLYRVGLAPRKDIDAADAQLAQDKADADAARDQATSQAAAEQSAELHSALARRDLSNSVLRAPTDGVVSAVLRREGESVDSSIPVITISQRQSSDITLTVAAADLQKIHVGDPLRIAGTAGPAMATGTVIGISNSVDPTTETGVVVARGLSSLPIGSVLEAKIVVARERGLVVPESVLVQDPQTGHAVVFVAQQDRSGNVTFNQQVVTVRLSDGKQALISGGIRPGQRIASRGGFTLLAPSDSGDQ